LPAVAKAIDQLVRAVLGGGPGRAKR